MLAFPNNSEESAAASNTSKSTSKTQDEVSAVLGVHSTLLPFFLSPVSIPLAVQAQPVLIEERPKPIQVGELVSRQHECAGGSVVSLVN
jgi:hypothetical protein